MKIQTHSDLSDFKFEEQFRDMTMDPALFTHEAHIRLAWIHLRRYGEKEAIRQICTQIKQFDHHHGNGTKYHETMTVAAVKVVQHFISKSKVSSFSDFLSEFPRLKTHFKELLDQHYSVNQLIQPEAKTTYFEPDLLPFLCKSNEIDAQNR